MGQEKPTGAVEVPDLSGMSPDECHDTLEEYGLYLSRRCLSRRSQATPPR
ncbi:MAG: PASTA domain-containing protein [Butyricicoccus sp.]